MAKKQAKTRKTSDISKSRDTKKTSLRDRAKNDVPTKKNPLG